VKTLYNKKYDEARPVNNERASNPFDETYRSAYRRDYARLIHSAAFRRLQGKTQLFPSDESDFFRNRLTHSLEVSQIAKSIASKFNHTHKYFKKNNINVDVVEIAGLAHDLGHPPFGHNGEEALDECMRNYGGFEGNAQTFRILARLEKRRTAAKDDTGPIAISVTGEDMRRGLNLTSRVLAAVLKYDREIPLLNGERQDRKNKLCKGYYQADKSIVDFVKANVVRKQKYAGKFKTIECTIMDVADDIAYSTYDLEDAFKAGFTDPLTMLSSSEELFKKVAKKVDENIKDEENGYTQSEIKKFLGTDTFAANHAEGIIAYLFAKIFEDGANHLLDKSLASDAHPIFLAAYIARDANKSARKLASNGYFRTDLTSYLVSKFINGTKIEFNPDWPMFSRVKLDLQTFILVEVLKRFNFESQILSSRLKVTQHRGKEIVKFIFDNIKARGEELLPDDCRDLYMRARGNDKYRVICDFIAGMTDRYAVEFYNRLIGSTPISIHKPF
jgi:dGTPase